MAEKSSKEKTALSLYTEFYKYDQKGEYERALKTINKIIQLCPEDATAFECKVVCLIYLNRFEDSLQQLNRNPKFASSMSFEKAYCLYRTNQPEAALHVIESCPIDHRIEELRAQVLYRLEKYKESLKVYEEIFRDDPTNEYEEERQTNFNAVLSFLKEENLQDQIKEDTYEMCYNKALVLINQELFGDAEKMLKKAEKMLRDVFEEEGASEDETEAELANIRVLQGYCFQKQGRTKEAHLLYLQVLKQKLEDPSLTAIASNNVAVINKDQNVFDSKKKMKLATNENLVHKLPSSHRLNIAFNNAIFNYYSNHHDQSVKQCDTIEKMWPQFRVQCKLLKAFNLQKAPTKLDPVELLQKSAKEAVDDNDKLVLKLTCVQLLLMKGDKLRACEVLEDLGLFKYKPAIVGALITLYMSLGKEDVALKVYEDEIEWCKSNANNSGLDLTTLFKQAADFHIRNGRPQVAAKSLEQLLAQYPNDLKTMSQLVIAYAQFDEKKAIETGKKLGSLKDIDVDVDTLESNIWLTTKKSTTVTSSSKTDLSPGPGDNSKSKKKHRKRKGKLPKDYDASSAPDPERWLPRYERTGYRKKRDRRMKDVIKGSQGTASGHSDQYDFSKMATAGDDEGPGSVDPSPMQQKSGQRQQQKKGGQKSKKNKRR